MIGAVVGSAWYGLWDVMRRYHRFEVRGLERLDAVRPALLVGYHGRSYATDLIMLQAMLRRTKRPVPRAIIQDLFVTAPVLRWLGEGGQFLGRNERDIAAAVARGEHIIVTPGGVREGYRGIGPRYRVDWEDHLGYLRLAVRHRLPILPVAASGVDDTYVGLNNGHAWGKRLRLPGGLPLWLAFGPLGLWPLSPPFPVKIVQHIGAPIDPFADGPVDADDRDRLLALHRRVQSSVQRLLDEARAT